MTDTRPTPEEFLARLAAEAAAPDTRTVRERDMFRHSYLYTDDVTITVDQHAYSAEYDLDDLPEDDLRKVIREDFAAWLMDALATAPKWASMVSTRRMGPHSNP
jgi:hypothetical protein